MYTLLISGGGGGLLPEFIKDAVNWMASPVRYYIGLVVLLIVVLKFRKQATHPFVISAFFALAIVFFGLAWQDYAFNQIITKPDNVPILILLASLFFFSWLALRRAVINDERTAMGKPTLEGELSKQKVFTWPDLVYTELICMVLFLALLIIWSICIQAPIEEAAAQARTPNPSKAPWYFLGLQELLVYFDPWIAGVLLPGLIVVGLMAIPYVDTNPKGNGYYTFNERPFAISFFFVGFLLFWCSFVILGTFLRGPNWSFFGPFEFWDLHKLEPMVSVDLSALFWVKLLGQPRPDAILLREAPGIILLLGYFIVLPPLLAKTVLKKMFADMGAVRFHAMLHMLLWFGLIPLKMGLRWTISLKYIVGIPEWFFNV